MYFKETLDASFRETIQQVKEVILILNLVKGEENLEIILKSLPDGVLIYNSSFSKIKFLNDAASKLLFS